jgi:hypothetical protein
MALLTFSFDGPDHDGGTGIIPTLLRSIVSKTAVRLTPSSSTWFEELKRLVPTK